MLGKIVLVVSVLKICAGDGPTNPRPQSNQAVSSQMFVRHDVPLSYKFNSVHIYSTPKPDQYKQNHDNPIHHLATPQPRKEIQYAPIYNSQAARNILHGKYPNKGEEIIPESLTETTLANTNIEPRPQELHNYEHKQEHFSYIPGYNVELLQAVNRFPGNNAVYRSYPNMAPHEKINKVNYLNQYILHQKQGENTTPIPNVTYFPNTQPEQTKATLSPFVPKQKISAEQKPKVYNAAHIATLKSLPSAQALLNIQELIPHPKTHRMLLNIARTYNIAANPPKASHASITMLKNVAAYGPAIINIPNPAGIEKNTRLLPLQSKPLHQSAHRYV